MGGIDTTVRGKRKKKSLKIKKKETCELAEKENVADPKPSETECGLGSEKDSIATDIGVTRKVKSRRERTKRGENAVVDSNADEVEESQKRKPKKKRKMEKGTNVASDANQVEESQKRKSKKKRKMEKGTNVASDANEAEEIQNGQSRKRKSEKKTRRNGVARSYIDAENMSQQKNGKARKLEDQPSNADNFVGKSRQAEEVYELSSGDESSKGMRKWVTEYYQSRPGLQVLQEKIDDYIVAYEAEKEQEKKAKEALIAEDGWTVVSHHKGRKKTVDSESGVAVGSVSQAAVLENLTKKKPNEAGLNLYQFQRREAKRNEIMELQSKFEQDKKRAQQLRAARKFRPL
ncbi:unnamed protein product [Cuscuta epithymum]|uniref:Ribosomal RNA-processing protein 7 C-terminal domain-containing protein n=1 Tax=Cuscuta epithymum TaxID=186058 RepID=A0AAV0DHZ4_9ASTE|nr:unnamed protein product [Cuscuta epithymum]